MLCVMNAMKKFFKIYLPVVLISQTDTDLEYTGFGGKVASSTAGDLVFTDSDGVTKLPFEIESYASTTGALVFI